MRENPYKFTGPLDPVNDKLVCIPRESEIDKVITGVIKGDYWTIMGPRQIGKTTFLRQLRHELSSCQCCYINMEIFPKDDEAFYEWIKDRIIEQIDAEPLSEEKEKWKQFGPELDFYYFLRTVKLKKETKIVLFFDEIEKAPSVASFLHIWRKVFHERSDQPELNKYAVIIAGAADLISLTIGPTSPFNIAQKLYLNELTEGESEKLIDEPCRRVGIKCEPEAKARLFSQTSGHPQLLQHLCSILVDKAIEQDKWIKMVDVENVVERLFVMSDNLNTLEKETMNNKPLGGLIRRILSGEEIDYVQYQEFSIAGIGPIIQRGRYCAIRNKIYEELLTRILNKKDSGIIEQAGKATYATTIYLNENPPEPGSIEQEKNFLKCLFNPRNISIEITKNGNQLKTIELNRTEKLIFCYLAYENYKASKAGFAASSRKYRFFAVPRNNLEQTPEWDIFVNAINERISLARDAFESDSSIRLGIFSIRKKLKTSEADDLLPRQKPGAGEGYWLKGTVHFAQE